MFTINIACCSWYFIYCKHIGQQNPYLLCDLCVNCNENINITVYLTRYFLGQGHNSLVIIWLRSYYQLASIVTVFNFVIEVITTSWKWDMATWGPSQPKKNVSQKGKRPIKLYVTTFTDEFDSERDYLNQEVHKYFCG